MIDQLRDAYRSHSLILFVGAGVSMGLGLPSWSGLVDHMAEELGYDPDIYRTFGSPLTLAEYYRIKRGIGPLRSWMDRTWHSNVDIATSRVHQIIAGLELDLIYTTNFDRLLESAFESHGKKYQRVAGVGDLTRLRQGVTQIVKFHGDFDDDSSIVLDESKYFERLAFESPLDIKLRSDVLGRTVLFIGYSLSDINVRYLFFRLANLWRAAGRGAEQPESYVFSPRPNPVQEATLAQWRIKMVSSELDDEGAALERFLAELS